MSVASDDGVFRSKSPTVLLTSERRVGRSLEGDTYEYEFVILSHAAKAVCPPVAAEVIKGKSRQEGRMPLTARDNSLLPRRENVYQVVLSASLTRKKFIRRRDAHRV